MHMMVIFRSLETLNRSPSLMPYNHYLPYCSFTEFAHLVLFHYLPHCRFTEFALVLFQF